MSPMLFIRIAKPNAYQTEVSMVPLQIEKDSTDRGFTSGTDLGSASISLAAEKMAQFFTEKIRAKIGGLQVTRRQLT